MAAVTGGLTGAVYGIAGIPMRWTSVVHGRVPDYADELWQLGDLHHLPRRWTWTRGAVRGSRDAAAEPREVADGVWAADLDGARHSSTSFAVVSLGRTRTRFPHEAQRFAYLTDDDQNFELDAGRTTADRRLVQRPEQPPGLRRDLGDDRRGTVDVVVSEGEGARGQTCSSAASGGNAVLGSSAGTPSSSPAGPPAGPRASETTRLVSHPVSSRGGHDSSP